MTQAHPIDPPLKRATGLRLWLPNAITGLRLLLSLVFFIQLARWACPPGWVGGPHPHIAHLWLASLSFALAAGTDALDGFLARRWAAVTRFGRIMDPFADKILIVGAFVMLAGPQFASPPDISGQSVQVTGVQSWMVVVILGRELLVTSIRAVLEAEGSDFSASLTGKLKMIVQSLAVPAALIIPASIPVDQGSTGRLLVDASAWVTTLITVISGVPYVLRGLAAFSSKNNP